MAARWRIYFWTTLVCPICGKFCTNTQNPSIMTTERHKFRILIIQDGGRICTETLRKYGHSKLSKMAAAVQDGGGRHLEFVRTENSAVRSAVPENSTLEPNMKWIGSPVAEIWPFAYVGGIWNPRFGGGKERS